jgi:hypothetical protein
MRRSFSAVAFWLTLACSAPAEPGEPPLRVTATDRAVLLENASQHSVFYFLYEREAAALINWAACVNSDCPSVAPGAQAAIPYPAIGGVAPGKNEVIVWWWEAVRGPAGRPMPGDVHTVVVSR